jgi:hypothetical protein
MFIVVTYGGIAHDNKFSFGNIATPGIGGYLC